MRSRRWRWCTGIICTSMAASTGSSISKHGSRDAGLLFNLTLRVPLRRNALNAKQELFLPISIHLAATCCAREGLDDGLTAIASPIDRNVKARLLNSRLLYR